MKYENIFLFLFLLGEIIYMYIIILLFVLIFLKRKLVWNDIGLYVGLWCIEYGMNEKVMINVLWDIYIYKFFINLVKIK